MVRFFAYFLCLTSFLFQSLLGQTTLVLTWEIQHPLTQEWMSLGERGSVQEALMAKGILPDAFYGENELLFQWIEDYSWHARARFVAPNDLLKASRVALELPCVDTYATLWLNQKKILETNNYFRPYSLEIQDELIPGINEFEVVFVPPVLYHKTAYEKATFHYPAPNDVSTIKVAPLTRKPQFHFGWDWAPRINTIGFPSPVTLCAKDEPIIKSCNVNTLSLSQEAIMEVVLIKKNDVRAKKIRSTRLGWCVTSDSLSMQHIGFKIANPILWWPNGMGESYRYLDTLVVENDQGLILERYPYVFGVRTVSLIQNNDDWGTSFAFEVNGKPVFMKGGNMIPPSVFGGITRKEEWEKWVQWMVSSHFNMVRIWGGGDYATEDFLNECDRLGLMVWHDAMFACAMYPGDANFLANVKEELDYQLPRLVKHPSVVYLNGNNEVDIAWKHWGLQLQYALTPEDQRVIEKAYDTLFKQLLPNTLSRISNTPYVHTSPLSNWGNPSYFNHGTQHYWGVWHGNDPLQGFEKNIGRFNAEFGFQSFPEFATLGSFCDSSDWTLNSTPMKFHQKSYVGNTKMLTFSKELYGSPSHFSDLVYFSQLTQAYAVSSAIGAHLLDAPRCMGTLYWQINDCWPAPTWSSIDYYGNWKALHYKVKDLYQNLSLVQSNQNQTLHLVANNVDNVNANLTVEVFRLKGRKLRMLQSQTSTVSLHNFESIKLFEAPRSKTPHIVKVRIGNGEERVFTFGTIKERNVIQPSLTVLSLDPLTKTGTLGFQNKEFMADVWFYSMTPGVVFERNFDSFFPGKHEIHFTFDTLPTHVNFHYR